MLPFDRPEVTDSAADVRADLLCDVVSNLESTVNDRFLRSSHGVLNEGAHLARLFLLDVFQRIKVFDFAGKFNRKLLSVELLYIVGTTPTIHQRSPRFFNRIANGSY